MKQLKISDKISLPLDAVTQTIAAIGRKGAGKTYLSSMICEQMLDAQAQVVVIDSIGNWYGLRIGADGKSKGKDIFVIGGANGDIPLVPEAGALIAQLIVDKGISAVLDVSGFRLGERKRFAADFGEELLHLKKTNKTPVHIFIEEAQLIIPQRVGPEEARMVGAFEQIVRLGRNYGIGCTLITQRPQSVNKEVLSQVECLCVLQVTGPHERKALENWVQEAGAERSLIGQLPGLKRGEGYVWSPSWLRIFERVQFSKKQTFDTSATPEVGKTMKAAKLSKVDVDELAAQMGDVVAKASENDPKALKKRIAELERDQKVGKVTAEVDNTVVIEKAVSTALATQARQYESRIKNLLAIFQKIKGLIPDAMPELPVSEVTSVVTSVPAVPSPLRAPMGITVERTKAITLRTVPESEMPLNGPEQRIVDAIAWMESVGITTPEQTAVAFLAGYKVGGGAFNNPKGSLRVKGLIEYLSGNLITLTDAGKAMAHYPDTVLTSAELHRKVLERLPGPESKLLTVLLQTYPTPISNEELAEHTGYTAGGGAFNNPKGRLKTLGLIEYPSQGMVVARSILFL